MAYFLVTGWKRLLFFEYSFWRVGYLCRSSRVSVRSSPTPHGPSSQVARRWRH